MSPMRIVDYRPELAGAFKTLNEAWITQLFALEAKDHEILGDPQGEVIDRGGYVLFVMDGEAAVGCCALIPMSDGGFQLSKMAVDEQRRGEGFGRAVLTAAIARARSLGAHRIYLESGSALTPALTLYRSLGFCDLAPERRPVSPYLRGDVWMELLF